MTPADSRAGLSRETEDTLDALPAHGFQGSPEEIERQWYEHVYRGRGDRMRQLTWRAIVMGSALGGVLSLTNLYIGLKAGWGFGVAITACILSYAIWTTLYRVGLVGTPMTILENNCMQSTASSAGYSTGGTLISAFAAYMLVSHTTLSLPLMLEWVFLLAVLGVPMVPMKRQMINIGRDTRQTTAVAAPACGNPKTTPKARGHYSKTAPTSIGGRLRSLAALPQGMDDCARSPLALQA